MPNGIHNGTACLKFESLMVDIKCLVGIALKQVGIYYIMFGWYVLLLLSTTTPADAAVVVERKVGTFGSRMFSWHNSSRRRLIVCCC